MSNLFAACFPCGIVYCDKSKEVSGDYKKIAFLPYNTLKLEIYAKRSKLILEIFEDIKKYKAGEELIVSSCGQKIKLGYDLK